MTIGNHLLKGKAYDMIKPLVLTEKVVNDVGDVEY